MALRANRARPGRLAPRETLKNSGALPKRLASAGRRSLGSAMPFELLHARLPDLAEAETRSVTVLKGAPDSGYPSPGEYSFLELFCTETGCDCRRVFFSVYSSPTQEPDAVIAYGWESKQFYRKWFKQGTEEDIAMLQGPVLNCGSRQGRQAEAILRLFVDCLLPDAGFIARVQRHYRLFRATVDKPRGLLTRRRKPGG